MKPDEPIELFIARRFTFQARLGLLVSLLLLGLATGGLWFLMGATLWDLVQVCGALILFRTGLRWLDASRSYADLSSRWHCYHRINSALSAPSAVNSPSDAGGVE